MRTARRMVAALAVMVCVAPLGAQWTNRYPKVAGMSHHIYLEGFELPILTNGPMDPAAAADGHRLAFASHGWIWIHDLDKATATRVTSGPAVDARPAWSADGSRIAFVRDDGRRLSIVVLDISSHVESTVVSDSAIVLDPAFSADGRSLYYSSAIQGDLDIWRLNLVTRATERITTTLGTNELQPMPTSDGQALLYLAKNRAGADQVRRRTLATGEDHAVATGSILSMMRGSVRNDGRALALTWPTQEGYELRLAGTQQPGEMVQLFRDPRVVPLAPAFSADGGTIWFSIADAKQRMRLVKVPSSGGDMQFVRIDKWEWQAGTAHLRVVTRLSSADSNVAARLALRTADGHPIVPDSGQVRFDGQNGLSFFYSSGLADVTVPAGDVDVSAVVGLATPEVTQRVHLNPGETRTITLSLTPVWDARAHGWLSGEHHFHLNYGGPYHLEPETLVPMGRAEDLDVLTPMLANLSHRFEDQRLFGFRRDVGAPWIVWSQEVRSHFLGHVGLINSDALFWPWIWGPGYDVNARDDRPNADVLAFAKSHRGISTYVHPVSVPEPFATAQSLRAIPLGFVADAVQGKVDALEVACLWSDERGSAQLWYRMLNVGIPVALNAGTDVMNNLYRTMAIGTTRVYVQPDVRDDPASYFAALKAGRSVVSTGPMLDFHVGRAGPGQVVARGAGAATYELDVHSAVLIDSVQIVVNGVVVTTLPAFTAPSSKHYTGTVELPAGGWLAARVSGPPTRAWPAMASYAYAHTSPVWIDRVGSTEPAAKLAAANDLRRALDVAAQAVEIGYTSAEHPRLLAHYAAARRVIDGWIAAGGR